jgi:UDP-N-acetylglucosamine 4,6-dehydratase/5-epimerase
MDNLNGKSILITGATGSFGSEALKFLINTPVSRLVVFSRDELKQHTLRNQLPKDERLRFFLGDIRDQERLETALRGIDYVIHAAALKQVDTGEYNPLEFVKTNIFGSQNLINASIKAGVRKVIALSTDKASSPINLYGATKLTADKLFTAANHYSFSHGTSFSVVRYGNVMGSRGSVIPLFLDRLKSGNPFPITDKRMTRFWITLEHAVRFVIDSFSQMQGGELYVPKIPSMRIIDLAGAISPTHPIEDIGIRPGEKLHEEMISPDDSRRTTELYDRYIVNPLYADWGYVSPKGDPVEEGFTYRSDKNNHWLNREEILTHIESYLTK